MSPAGTALHDRVGHYSAAQRRTVDAALELFSEHGVGGTSLQMIADALGVTKAAVYHQFRTKDAIVLAVLEVQLEPFEALLAEAVATGGADTPGIEARRKLLAGIVELVVARRRSFAVLQSDPVLFRLLGEHPPSLRMWTRLFEVLLGGPLDERARVRSSIASAAIGAVAYPFVGDVDDETMRDELYSVTAGLLFER